MEYELYTARYLPTGECGPPFTAKGREHALRIFRSLLKDLPDEDKADFVLYRAGGFNASTGFVFGVELEEVAYGDAI